MLHEHKGLAGHGEQAVLPGTVPWNRATQAVERTSLGSDSKNVRNIGRNFTNDVLKYTVTANVEIRLLTIVLTIILLLTH